MGKYNMLMPCLFCVAEKDFLPNSVEVRKKLYICNYKQEIIFFIIN